MPMVTFNPTVFSLGTINGYSTSDTTRISKAFPNTPAMKIPALSVNFNESFSEWAMVKYYQENVLNAKQVDNLDFPEYVDMDYGTQTNTIFSLQPPKLADIPTSRKKPNEGWPMTAYTPNIVSPGPGSENPKDMGVVHGALAEAYSTPSYTPVNGYGWEMPWESSNIISKQKMGNYMMGRSSPAISN